MKPKLILLAIFLLSSHISKGQGGDGELMEKCCIDSQTGDTVRTTFWIQVAATNNYLLNFRMKRINSIYTLGLSYHFGGGVPFAVAKGDSVWIKFVGGYKIVLFANDSITSRRGGAMIPWKLEGGVTYGVAVKYNLSQQQILAFAGNEIEKIRFFSPAGFNDINWPKAIHDEFEPKPNQTIQAAKLLLEKRKKYKICAPDAEAVKVNKEEAKKEEF